MPNFLTLLKSFDVPNEFIAETFDKSAKDLPVSTPAQQQVRDAFLSWYVAGVACAQMHFTLQEVLRLRKEGHELSAREKDMILEQINHSQIAEYMEALGLTEKSNANS